METKLTSAYFLFLFFLLSACSSNKLLTDRSQFLRDGVDVPTVNLAKYKSVQLRAGQNADLGLAVSISGGGSRSANFAMGVLLGLEKLQSDAGNVLQELDYISTVSGGGFAGGAYINALFEHRENGQTEIFSLQKYFKENIKASLSRSYTRKLVKANFNPRLWFSHADDGDALERAVDDFVLGYQARLAKLKKQGKTKMLPRSVVLGDLFIDKDSIHHLVHFPMMFANGSVFDKMAIFPFSPDILESYKVNGYKHRMKKVLSEKLNPYTMPLAVGIKASGSFPVLISNTTLRSNFHGERNFLHIIDGAMTDNFGYYTALDVLKKDSRATRKVLFIIDADNGGMLPTFSKKRKSISSIKVYQRLASSGLDARRMTVLKEIRELSGKYGFSPVFFSFNVLIENNTENPPKVILIKEETNRLIEKMKKDLASLTPLDLQILYDLATHVGTKYTITASEQELLILTGQKVVELQAAKILALVK